MITRSHFYTANLYYKYGLGLSEKRLSLFLMYSELANLRLNQILVYFLLISEYWSYSLVFH